MRKEEASVMLKQKTVIMKHKNVMLKQKTVMLNLFQHLKKRSRTKFGMTVHKFGVAVYKLGLTVLFTFFLSYTLAAQPVPGSYYDFVDATKDLPAGHDKTSLIIYRPDNVGVLNDIRCFLRIQDEAGQDITYDTSRITATYEWMSTPDIIHKYKHTYFLSGGMAMHLKLKKGHYKISLYTPVDQQNNFVYPESGEEARTALQSGVVEYSQPQTFQWESNVFEYNTENPTKVIFVTPTRNDNGFYNGGWVIDYKDGRKP